MWPWVKVKVNIINTWYILMSEAVTIPSLMMMTSTVSEESLARDTHTHASSIANFLRLWNYENKKKWQLINCFWSSSVDDHQSKIMTVIVSFGGLCGRVEEKKMFLLGVGMTPSKWRCQGWKTALLLGGVHSRLWLQGKKVLLLYSVLVLQAVVASSSAFSHSLQVRAPHHTCLSCRHFVQHGEACSLVSVL